MSGQLRLADFGGGGARDTAWCAAISPATRELIKPVLAGLPRVLRVNLRADLPASGSRTHCVTRSTRRGGRGAGQRCIPRAPGRSVVRRSAASLSTDCRKDAPAGSPARVMPRSGARWRRCIASPRATGRSTRWRAAPAISRSASDREFARYLGLAPMSLSHRLAAGARRRGAAVHQSQRAARCARCGLRIRGRVQSRVQAAFCRAAGALSARMARSATTTTSRARLQGARNVSATRVSRA